MVIKFKCIDCGEEQSIRGYILKDIMLEIKFEGYPKCKKCKHVINFVELYIAPGCTIK